MVKEHRYVFDVSDIASLLYVCSNCGEEVACKLDGDFEPSRCSICKSLLFKEAPFQGTDPKHTDPNHMVLRELRRIQKETKQKETKPRVQLRFVLSDPDKPVKSTG